jgi:hypothetical protein
METGEVSRAEGATGLDAPVRECLLAQLEEFGAESVEDRVAPTVPEPAEEAPAVTCYIELGAFNPGF